MTSEEFQQLRMTFDRIVGTPERDRAALLKQVNPAIASELKRMLDAHSNGASFLDEPAVEPGLVPLQIGAYRIEEELGRGGMGIVYRASRSDGSFHKLVAIKILRHDRIDPLFLRRFHQEREILAQLNHPHIASILDGGTTPEGDPYFVMEFVEGVPITMYCETHPLTIDQKLDLFLQVCDAVQHAHRNLTVHRDLKPGNILVTKSGAVKLLDFGIAKLLQPLDVGPSPTVAILTPEYASPEQIRGEPITTSADVFALGILLYEILSGVHPFHPKGSLPHEVMSAICEQDPALMSTVAAADAKELRGELDTIASTALRKQPAWRYPAVEQLADDINRYRRGWPVLAKGDGLRYRFRKFARRQWLPLTGAALVMALLMGGMLAIQHEAQLADLAREAAERALGQAEHERAIATEQRQLAEARTKEAETERRKERDRYLEVRSLAASLLFELHDGIRDLAGSTTARRLIVSKAQRQLELLNADSGDDIELQRDLAASYERMGELQVGPAELDAYRRAVSLRRKIAARADSRATDKRDLALSLSKLGDGHFMASDMKQALESYANARSLAQELRASAAQQRTLGEIDERRCIVLLAAGRSAAALETCQEGLATLAPLAKASPDDVEIARLIATTQASYANALRFSQKPQDAVTQAKLAIDSLARLTALAPSNAEYRRLASSAQMILAASLAANGEAQASLDAFRRSVQAMEIAIEIDPSDLGSSLRLAVTLRAFSRRLNLSGKKEQAHDAAREAIHLLEQTAAKPGAGAVEWNEYADALIKAEWPDLQQPTQALKLAQNAVAATERKNPFFLDTLAWAFFRNDNAANAVETEREALRLLPVDAKGGLHDELDRGLKTFLATSSNKF